MAIQEKKKYVSRKTPDFRIRVYSITKAKTYAEDRAIVCNINQRGRVIPNTLRFVRVDSIRRKYFPV